MLSRLHTHHTYTVALRTASSPKPAPDSEAVADLFTPSEVTAEVKPKSWTPPSQSPKWQMALASLPGALAVGLHAGTQENTQLAEYLEAAGRPNPKEEAAYLQAGDWGAMSAEQAAPFYVLGHQQYPPDLENRDELIELSLQELGRYLERGMMGEVPFDKRLELCYHLLENIPVQPTETILDFEGNSEWSYPVFTSEAYTRVSDLHKIATSEKEEKIGFHVGAQMWNGQFSPPSEPVDRETATTDYTRYLHLVTHAEGRVDPKRVWGDDHNAMSACNVVYNGFQRDPDKTATFESFLKLTGAPWASYGYTEMSHALPESDREQFNDHLTNLYREVREKRGTAPQEKLSQIDEEKYVESKIQWAYQVASGRAPDQSVTEALEQAQPLYREFVSTFPRMAHMEAYSHMKALREPGQSFNDVFPQYMQFNQQLRGSGDALDGLYATMDLFEASDNPKTDIQPLVAQMTRLPEDRWVGKKALKLAGAIKGSNEELHESLERLVDGHLILAEGGLVPEQAQQLLGSLYGGTEGPQDGVPQALAVVVEAVEPGSMPAEVMGTLVKTALSSDKSNAHERIQELAHQYTLTGEIDGLDKIRGRIESDLEKGVLDGKADQLFDSFQHHARLQSLMTDDFDKIIENAYDAIRPPEIDSSDIVIEEDYVSIGGILLDRM